MTVLNLPAGTFTAFVELTSDPRCPAQLVFTVNQPALDLGITAVPGADVTCTNDKGTITINTFGGTAPYVINVQQILPGSIPLGTQTTGLSAGTYTVKVTDANNCDKSATVILAPQAPITTAAIAIANQPLCVGLKTAKITVTGVVGGHVGNYSYTLTNTTTGAITGPQSSNEFPSYTISNPLFPGLGAGVYTITVSDDYGCSWTSGPQTITEPTKVNAQLGQLTPIDCVNGAVLTILATGGTPPYTYSTNFAGPYSSTTFNPLVTIPNTVPGTYNYFVKDANGCISDRTGDVVVQPIPVLTLPAANILTTNVTCFGNATGVIIAQAQGGFNTNYTYTISPLPGVGYPASNTTGRFDNLPAGFYNITVVTSAGGCVFTTPSAIEITQPLEFIVTLNATNVTCFDAKNGELNITLQNAIGTVQYIITPLNPDLGAQDVRYIPDTLIPEAIKGLEPNTYSIVVQDQANCAFRGTFTITEPSKLENIPTTGLVQAPCAGVADGQFTINIVPLSGTPPYTASVDGAAYVAVTGSSYTFVNQTGGAHNVTVRDANGCLINIPVTLNASLNISARVDVKYLCPNPTNDLNTLTVVLNDSTINLADVTYALDVNAIANYQSSNVFTNVAPGMHVVYVKHTNGCILPTTSYNVKFIDPLALSLTQGNLNEIIAIATGGTTPYTFDFNGTNTGTNNTYIFPKTDKYFVTVTDSSGCLKTVSKTFTFIDIFIPNFFTPDGDGNNDGWGPTNTYNYKNLIYYIFDRYGRKIATYNEGQYWDGKYEGQELPSGDYWYMVKPDGANDGVEYVGNFTLYR